MYLVLICVYFANVIISPSTQDNIFRNISHEDRLRYELLRNYGPLGTQTRPIRNSSDKIVINFGMRLIKIELSERLQSLRTSVYSRIRWYDEFMSWKPEDYGGLSRITFPVTSVWTPSDVTAVNTAEPLQKSNNVDVKVSSNGMIFWAPMRQFETDCLMDLTNYPFDTHICDIWVQSLSGYGDQIDLQLYQRKNNNSTPWELDTYMKTHTETQEWSIIGNETKRTLHSREHGVVLMYSNKVALKFSLKVQRKPGFKACLLIFPGIILSYVATFIFCLPPDRPDRNMLAMSLFASFMLLLLILIDNVPPTAAAIPRLVWTYCFNLSITVACVLASILIINIGRIGETRKVPSRALQKVMFGVFAHVLCNKERIKEVYLDNLIESESENSAADHFDKQKSLNKSLLPKHTKRDINARQWKAISYILDRCFFLLFVASNTIAIVFLFPWPFNTN